MEPMEAGQVVHSVVEPLAIEFEHPQRPPCTLLVTQEQLERELVVFRREALFSKHQHAPMSVVLPFSRSGVRMV